LENAIPVLGVKPKWGWYFGYFSRWACVKPYLSKDLGESVPSILLSIGYVEKLPKYALPPF